MLVTLPCPTFRTPTSHPPWTPTLLMAPLTYVDGIDILRTVRLRLSLTQLSIRLDLQWTVVYPVSRPLGQSILLVLPCSRNPVRILCLVWEMITPVFSLPSREAALSESRKPLSTVIT